jgi:hypothetical protein
LCIPLIAEEFPTGEIDSPVLLQQRQLLRAPLFKLRHNSSSISESTVCTFLDDCPARVHRRSHSYDETLNNARYFKAE